MYTTVEDERKKAAREKEEKVAVAHDEATREEDEARVSVTVEDDRKKVKWCVKKRKKRWRVTNRRGEKLITMCVCGILRYSNKKKRARARTRERVLRAQKRERNRVTDKQSKREQEKERGWGLGTVRDRVVRENKTRMGERKYMIGV